MSSVTINELAWDYKHNTMQKELVKSQDIEIVPRKMVEMIIEHYDKIIDDSEKEIAYFHEDSDAFHTATIRKSCVGMLKVYAETLLKQFEGDE